MKKKIENEEGEKRDGEEDWLKFASLKCDRFSILKQPKLSELSDHWPILSTIRWPQKNKM